MSEEEIELRVKLVLTPELKNFLAGSRVQIPEPKPVEAEPKLMIVGHDIVIEKTPEAKPIADFVQKFAKLDRASEDLMIFNMNQLSLWKAAERYTSDEIIEFVKQHAKTPPKDSLKNWIARTMSIYGALKIVAENTYDVLESVDTSLLDRVLAIKNVRNHIYKRLSPTRARITHGHRGHLKQTLLDLGFPVKDLGRYEEFEPIRIEYKPDFKPYPHQKEALKQFLRYGAGTIILPGGTGKTVIAVMATTELKAPTLILATRAQICEQFRREFLEKTTVSSWNISVIHGGTYSKEVKPITITTYQSATGSIAKKLWDKKWGLIVYDESQHVPSDVWRKTARLQAVRRLGLTATPVREDKQEKLIFSLIGPPVYDRGWLEMAEEGWIAKARAIEILVDMPPTLWKQYQRGDEREKYVLASTNPAKLPVIRQLLEKHKDDKVLILGYYVEGALELGKQFDIPVIYGGVPPQKRDELYNQFRQGKISRLILTSVGEEGVDLPDANVLIEVCSLYGSRMKTGQRFGRILRPKEETAVFYELVSRGTTEQDFSERRREFLISKGYEFESREET
jgi:DNA excision repair protein ERCC-3